MGSHPTISLENKLAARGYVCIYMCVCSSRCVDAESASSTDAGSVFGATREHARE